MTRRRRFVPEAPPFEMPHTYDTFAMSVKKDFFKKKMFIEKATLFNTVLRNTHALIFTPFRQLTVMEK